MSKKRYKGHITFVLFLIGFFIAIQYNTSNKNEGELSNLYLLKDELQAAQEHQLHLSKELERYEAILKEYEDSETSEQLRAFSKNIQELRKRYGTVAMSGEGVIIEITPLQGIGDEVPKLTSMLVTNLINEINKVGRTHVSIGNERVIPTTSIRDINGTLAVNGDTVTDVPLQVKLLTDTPDLYSEQLSKSTIQDEFAFEGWVLSIQKVDALTLPAYDKKIHGNLLVEDVK